MISEAIKYIGVNDHNIDLFEGQYDVPNGMAYNSYAIIDKKIAIMDTVDANFGEEWLNNIKTALNGKKPNFLVGFLFFCPHFCCFFILSFYFSYHIKNNKRRANVFCNNSTCKQNFLLYFICVKQRVISTTTYTTARRRLPKKIQSR